MKRRSSASSETAPPANTGADSATGNDPQRRQGSTLPPSAPPSLDESTHTPETGTNFTDLPQEDSFIPSPTTYEDSTAGTPEKLGRLLYEVASELSNESSFQVLLRRNVRATYFWANSAFKDAWKVLSVNLLRFRTASVRALTDELVHPILEIMFFPKTVKETIRTRAYMLPFQGIQNYFAQVKLHTEFRDSVNYSYNHAIALFYSKWSRPGKIYICGVTLLSIYTLYHYGLRAWPLHDVTKEVDCLHKTVVITGSSAGIGYKLAYEFARRGAFVIITSPDMVKARKARLDLSRRIIKNNEQQRRRYIDEAEVRYYEQLVIPPLVDVDFLLHNIVEVDLNLASTASIYSFTRKVQGMSPQGIDILINNASVNTPPDEMVVSDEGKEVHFAVNYFGHFILTNLLMGQLAKRKGSRIINVTCKYAAERGFINLKEFIQPYMKEDGLPFLPAEKGYENSKLAIYLFNRRLSKELLLSGIHNVTTYAVCPGTTRTFIGRHVNPSYFHSKYWGSLAKPFYKKDFHAAQTILHCALSTKVAHESGFFYENNRKSILKTQHKDVDKIAKCLWVTSLSLMGVGHNSMLKLTEQMHIRSHENIFQLGSGLFLQRRDVMTHLLLMEEQHAYKNRHKKFVNEMGDARDNFTYFWHGFYLAGGNRSTLVERWVLYNTHPGFRELQKEYDVRFETSGSSHFFPQATGKITSLQYMASMPEPLTQDDIEELDELYESESDPDDDIEFNDRFYKDYIAMDELIT